VSDNAFFTILAICIAVVLCVRYIAEAWENRK